ncbi:hypothetical protein EDB89DRAFT_1911702 [Lactarius sanguifluus]|nr:hypothetical protein EDB89DRAFT_1911702 [Lactarius sanguifluus]
MGRMEVDRALKTIDDWPLTAEVQHYHMFMAELEEQHDQATQLRQKIADTMAQIHGSVYRLSQNNVYQRVQTVLQREDDPILWLANSELRAEMHTIMSAAGAKDRITTPLTASPGSPSLNAHSARNLATMGTTVSAHTSTAGKIVLYHVDTVDTRDPVTCAPYLMRPLAKKNSVAKGGAKSDSNAVRINALDIKEGSHSRSFSMTRCSVHSDILAHSYDSVFAVLKDPRGVKFVKNCTGYKAHTLAVRVVESCRHCVVLCRRRVESSRVTVVSCRVVLSSCIAMAVALMVATALPSSLCDSIDRTGITLQIPANSLAATGTGTRQPSPTQPQVERTSNNHDVARCGDNTSTSKNGNWQGNDGDQDGNSTMLTQMGQRRTQHWQQPLTQRQRQTMTTTTTNNNNNGWRTTTTTMDNNNDNDS